MEMLQLHLQWLKEMGKLIQTGLHVVKTDHKTLYSVGGTAMPTCASNAAVDHVPQYIAWSSNRWCLLGKAEL